MYGANEMGEKKLGSVCIFKAVNEFYLVMFEQINNRIIESLNMLGRDPEDHEVQLLPLHRSCEESHHVPDSIVQILFELQQAWCCDHFPGS